MNNIRGAFESAANLVSMNTFQDDGEGNNSWIGVGPIALATIAALAVTIYHSKAGYFFSMRASDDDMCVVCQNDFNEDLDAVGHFINDVKHIFHRTCAEPWVNKHHDCLICRIPVESIDPTLFTRLSHNPYIRYATSAAINSGVTGVSAMIWPRELTASITMVVWVLMLLTTTKLFGSRDNLLNTGAGMYLAVITLIVREGISGRPLGSMELMSAFILTSVLCTLAVTAYRHHQ